MAGKTIVIDENLAEKLDPMDPRTLKLEAEALKGGIGGTQLTRAGGKIVHKLGIKMLLIDSPEQVEISCGKEGKPF